METSNSTALAIMAAFLIFVNTVIMIINGLRSIFQKGDPGKEAITREELNNHLSDMNRKVDVIKTDVHSQVAGLKADLSSRMDKQEEYAHRTYHTVNNALHTVMLKIQTLLVLQGATKTDQVEQILKNQTAFDQEAP